MQSSVKAYVAAQEKAAMQIKRIEKYLADHHDSTNPDGVNWGHVGDIDYIAEQLDEILAD